MARYYRWRVRTRKMPSAGGIAATEFHMLVGGSRVAATSVTGSSSAGEVVTNLNDNTTATKWYCDTASYTTVLDVVFDYGTSITPDSYRWYTGAEGGFEFRDPVSWEVWSSDDASTWTIIDSRIGYPVTQTRSAIVGPFTFNNPTVPASPYIRYLKWTVTKRRTAGHDMQQAAEWAVALGDTRIAASHVIDQYSSGPVGFSAQDILNLNNNDITSSNKWFMGGIASQTTPIEAIFDYGYSDIAPTTYYWYTAEDAPERDPVSWTVAYSEDLVTWTTLDTRTDYAVSTSRNVVVGPFTLTPPDGGGQSVRFGSAASASHYIRSHSGLDGGVDVTMAGWVYLTADRNDYSTFFGLAGDANYYSLIQTDTDGTTMTWQSNGSTTITGPNMALNTWYYVAAVYQASGTDTLYWAQSGTSTLSSATGSTQTIAFSHTNYQIGNSNFGEWLNGRISAHKIWTAALTQVELEAEMATYDPVRTSNLWAYYSFRNGPQTHDETPNQRTLTASGTLITEVGPPVGAPSTKYTELEWSIGVQAPATGTYEFRVFYDDEDTPLEAYSVTPQLTIGEVPDAPTAVSGVRGNAQVVLTWTAPGDDGGVAITDYKVEYAVSPPGTTWVPFSDAVSATTGATVTGLTNGTAYIFRIAAVNSVGQGAWSTESSAVTPLAPVRVQEGFRWRNDDGSETTATWKEAQDTDTTSPLSTTVRLRTIVDAIGDFAATAYSLRYKKSTDSVYNAVPLAGASTTIASTGTMGTGTSATSTTTIVTTTATNALAIGDTAIITIVADNTSTTDADNSEVSSVTDSAGNTWEKLGERTNTVGGAAGDGVTTSVWMTYATAALAIGGTITATFGTARTHKTTSVWKFTSTRKLIKTTGVTNPVLNGTDGAAGFGSAVFSGLSSLQRLYFRGLGKEANATTANTQTTNFTNITLQRSQNNAAAVMVRGEFRINTSTGETSNPTNATTGDTAGVFVALEVSPSPIVIPTSTNITAGGEATTAQLTAPSGKTTADFLTGRMWDDENGTDTIDITLDDYTELEWSILPQAPAVNTDMYDFRIYAGGVALDTYSVTPRLTVGTVAATVFEGWGVPL